MKKNVIMLLVMALLLTMMPLSIAAEDVGATEGTYINVYDAQSLGTALMTEGANIVLWGDITYSETVAIACNSLDLNGYTLTCTKRMTIQNNSEFTILDSVYDSESQTSTGGIKMSKGITMVSASLVIQSGVVDINDGGTAINGAGSGDFTIIDGKVNISGTDGTDGIDGSNGKKGRDQASNYVTPTAGNPGENGAAGSNGYNAVHVANVIIYKGTITIIGGNGGNGGAGGNGGKGGCTGDPFAIGKYGGDGGNGGNAGEAGAGIVAESVTIYGGNISIIGGAGGNGGNGGNGGEGGDGGIGGKGGTGGKGGYNSHGREGVKSSNLFIYGGEITILGGQGATAGAAGKGGADSSDRPSPGYGNNGNVGAFNGYGGAGINADVTISDGLVNVIGGTCSAAIGGSGYSENTNGKSVIITGGKVVAQAGNGGFDIGSGYDGTKYGAAGKLEVTGGILEFHTFGKATNVSNPIFKNCTVTGAGAFNHEGTYNANGKFSVSVTDVVTNPADCVGYDNVTLSATLTISRTTNITTPSPKGYISFKLDGAEIGTAIIVDPILEGDHIAATASIDWIAVENNHLITAEYIVGTNDKYSSAGVFEFNSNIAEHTHDWEDDFTVDLNPTCVTVGQKSIHCSICDAQKDITEIPTSNHNYVNNKCQYCEDQQPLVVFKNYDGSILSSAYYCIGDVISVPNDPTRDEDNTYTYKFVGWDKEIVNCDGSKEYTAIYESIYKNYTVTFKNYNGDVIDTKTYHYGDAVVVPSTPQKPSDGNFCYVFAGWNKSVTNCYGDAEYTAQFTAQDLPIVAVDSSSARAGEIVTLNVVLSNAPALESLSISEITYNTSALELINVEWKVSNAFLLNWDDEMGMGAVMYSSPTDLNGTILAFSFKVKDGVADGKYSISCKVASLECNFKNISGEITVCSVVPGDVDGNELVDKNDAIRLMMHIMFPSSYPVNQNADFTGDSVVDKADAIYLMMHIMFPSAYPIK